MPLIDIGVAADFPEGCGVAIVVGGRRLAVFRTGGALYAVDNLCPHRRFPLHDGVVAGLTIRCRTHGSCFRLDSGELVRGPARRGIAAYRIDVVGERVVVDLPD